MDYKSLSQFLVSCTKEGYASGDTRVLQVEGDRSTSIRLSKGPWSYHDNFFGGDPFGGRIVVCHEQKPVWVMLYYGQVLESHEDTKTVYQFLLEALAAIPELGPYRGPKEFRKDSMRYYNDWNGNLESFFGEEYIRFGDLLVYDGRYFGGLVNSRE